jgi:hypothetical protein
MVIEAIDMVYLSLFVILLGILAISAILVIDGERIQSTPIMVLSYFVFAKLFSVRRLLGGSRCHMCGSESQPLARIGQWISSRDVRYQLKYLSYGPFCRRCIDYHPLIFMHGCGYVSWTKRWRRTRW